MFVAQDYISVIIHILLSSAWNDGSDFIYSWKIVAPMISTLLQNYCHSQVALSLCRAVMHDLISLLVQWDKWIDRVQHVLKFSHKTIVKVGVMVVANSKGSLFIIDVQLGIGRWFTI